MKVGIVLLLSLLCVAQALPLTLNEKESRLTRGKRHESRNSRNSKNIADKEVRTIISAIVDAILDGDRKKRSDIPEEDDDEKKEEDKNEITESGSGINEETAVLNITFDSQNLNTNNDELFQNEIVEPGSGSGNNIESGSGLDSEEDLKNGFVKRTDTLGSAKLAELDSEDNRETDSESESGSGESESGSGETERESGETEDELEESGSGSGLETDEIELPEENHLQFITTEQSRTKRDEDGLDNTKTNIKKNDDTRSTNNKSGDFQDDSGSGSGFESGSESGDSNTYELDIRNGQLDIDSSKTTTKEKRSPPLNDKNGNDEQIRSDVDFNNESESSSASGSNDVSAESPFELSGIYSGDSDTTEVSKSKRSLTQGDEDESTDGESNSGSGLESGSGNESGDESGTPWDDGSGFSFDKRTKLTSNSDDPKDDFSESGSESATEENSHPSRLTETSSNKGEDSDGNDETADGNDETGDENNQYEVENNKSRKNMNDFKTVSETEAKVPKLPNKNENESKEGAEDNKSEYDSDSPNSSDDDEDNENKKPEYLDGSESEFASGSTETSGSGDESGSGQYSHEKKTKIIREIVTDMAKAAVDAVEIDDNDRVVKKSELSLPNNVATVELEKLKSQNSEQNIDKQEAMATWKPLNEDSVGNNDNVQIQSSIATKKATLETFTKSNEMNEALKDLVKSILRDDPAVHSSIQQLSKKREEDEEKLYRDIFDLVQHEPVEPEDEMKEKVITEVKDFEGFVEALSQTETLSPGKHELIAKKLEKDLLNHLRVKEREDPLIQQQEDELLKDSELSFVKDKIDEARESAEEYALKHFGNLEEIRKHAIQSLKPVIESLPLKREDIEGLVKSITKSAWVKMITHTKMKPSISNKLRRSLEELLSID